MWSDFLSIPETPVALLRGETSDSLPAQVAERVVRRHPRTTLTVVRRVGHPPLLEEPKSLSAIRSLLARCS